MEPRWLNNPRYQKAVQRMARLDPTRQAILDTVIADEAFADREMRTRLAMMKLAAQKTANQRNLDLNERRIGLQEGRLAHDKARADARYGIAEEKFDISKGQSDLAENLGWANIGLSGLRGYTDLREKKRKTKYLQDLARSFEKRS
jgi:hypothetical protein